MLPTLEEESWWDLGHQAELKKEEVSTGGEAGPRAVKSYFQGLLFLLTRPIKGLIDFLLTRPLYCAPRKDTEKERTHSKVPSLLSQGPKEKEKSCFSQGRTQSYTTSTNTPSP